MQRTTPGDFFLLHETDWQSRAIQWGTKSHWNHAGLITGEFGATIEAFANGVAWGNLSRYDMANVLIVPTNLTDEQRYRATQCAAKAIGDKYDWFDIVGFAINLMTDGKYVLGQDGHMICSELVAYCLGAAGVDLPDDPHRISPGDLAQMYKVDPH